MHGLRDAIELRRTLHAIPELAGHEASTARLLAERIAGCAPDELLEGIGGHGLAAVFAGDAPGPTMLLRAELDALPIQERLAAPHASPRSGIAHLCGHDGHMAVLVALAAELHARPLRSGRVVLLFQPAEETGEGARRVLDDERFAGIRPDRAFALHNLPGFAPGEVVLRDGPFASASRGLVASLEGVTSHAGEPERGRSPALALAQIIQGLTALPQVCTPFHEAALVTVVGARLGGRAFGTSPGDAEVMATLRSHRDEQIDGLWERCARLVTEVATAHDVTSRVTATEDFPATINDPPSTALVREAAARAGCAIHELDHPFAWSEDFGHFTREVGGALFGIGAGEDHPALHSPGYDFPDEIIEKAARVLDDLVDLMVGGRDERR